MTANQQELFNTRDDTRIRQGRVRFECIRQYLDGLRANPVPTRAELNTGQVLTSPADRVRLRP